MSVGLAPQIGDWVNARQAMKLAGCKSPSTIYKAALLGEIRTKIQPGRDVMFEQNDARAFGQSRRPMHTNQHRRIHK